MTSHLPTDSVLIAAELTRGAKQMSSPGLSVECCRSLTHQTRFDVLVVMDTCLPEGVDLQKHLLVGWGSTLLQLRQDELNAEDVYFTSTGDDMLFPLSWRLYFRI